MNKVFIIGNGFDLAHGVETKYSDFLLWYFNDFIEKRNKDRFYKDILMEIPYEISYINPIENLNDTRRPEIFKIELDNILNKTLEEYNNLGWVDIEYLYFELLSKIFKQYENVIDEDGNWGVNRVHGYLIQLNKSLEFLRSKFIEYLESIDYSKFKQLGSIFEKIYNEHEFDDKNNRTNSIIYLIFNYTEIFKKHYHKLIRPEDKLIYIHGELGNPGNPIIFGYGDESTPIYQQIEDVNINDFTTHFKSFKYHKTSAYKELFGMLNRGKYEAIIMGHSCGISDRVLLREILTPTECDKIKLYYHKRDDGTTDLDIKWQELSRHFPLSIKQEMRLKISTIGPLT